MRRGQRSQGRPISLNRTSCGFIERQDEYNIGPCSYTPNITAVKRRSPALIKYSLPKDKEMVKRLQGYIDSAQRKSERKNLEEIGRNVTSTVGGSYTFMSKVKKELMTFDQDIPGPGFYHKEDSGYQCKGVKFATGKKSTKLVNYNNALLVKTQNEVYPGVGTYYKKAIQRSNPTNTFPCSYLSNQL